MECIRWVDRARSMVTARQVMSYSRAMGADCTAAWLGAIVISALSFVPSTMAPTRRARHAAGLWARLSLPVSLAAAIWSSLSILELTPPPGGVFVSVAYPFLFVPVGLAAWGLGLIAGSAAERAFGARVPTVLAFILGAASVAALLAAK